MGSNEKILAAAAFFLCVGVADVNAFILPFTSRVRLRGKSTISLSTIFYRYMLTKLPSSLDGIAGCNRRLFSTQEEVMTELANFERREPQTVQNEDDWRRLRRSIIARQR